MQEFNIGVGLTTIYRSLTILEKENKVRTEVRDHTKYYQYIKDGCSKHFHLKCKKCGKMQHLDCREFMQATKHIVEDHDFEVDYNTIIYGVCGKCAKK
jgi:Fe2+ or Zn2+ uptake regulation protein